MVSLWPFKGEDTSAASFEKALSALASKISKSQNQLNNLQQRGRRLQALWTLYTSFAYLLCVIILLLVVGWKNWTALEYTALAASPVAIWLIRSGINAYYNFRVDTLTQRLEAQQAERVKTIEKLKAATKYNSTQELLEKYGGATPKPKSERKSLPANLSGKTPKPVKPPRASLGPPPPTANIQRPIQFQPQPVQGQPSTPQSTTKLPTFYRGLPPDSATPQAEFAPNAYSTPPQYATGEAMNLEGHWYDRVLDLLLGEDETAAKNRLALICPNCRLVNGQAPPGTKSLAELGKWKCFGCGAMNGEDDEAAKAVKEMKEMIEEKVEDHAFPSESKVDTESVADGGEGRESEGDIVQDVVEKGTESDSDTVEVKPSKGRPKSNRAKA